MVFFFSFQPRKKILLGYSNQLGPCAQRNLTNLPSKKILFCSPIDHVKNLQIPNQYWSLPQSSSLKSECEGCDFSCANHLPVYEKFFVSMLPSRSQVILDRWRQKVSSYLNVVVRLVWSSVLLVDSIMDNGLDSLIISRELSLNNSTFLRCWIGLKDSLAHVCSFYFKNLSFFKI